VDGKLQENVKVSLPFFGRADVTNPAGKFIIKDLDSSLEIDINFIHEKSNLDTLLRYPPGKLKASMFFYLMSRKTLKKQELETDTGSVILNAGGPNKTNIQSPIILTGFIKSNQAGLPGVLIQTENGDTATSDNSGNFRIRIPNTGSSSLIRISFIKEGYRPDTRYVNPDQSDIVITLVKL
jgi:hypothetical protein